jgi:hypothetical protein
MGDQNKRVLRAKIARRELLLTARDEEGPFDESPELAPGQTGSSVLGHRASEQQDHVERKGQL